MQSPGFNQLFATTLADYQSNRANPELVGWIWVLVLQFS